MILFQLFSKAPDAYTLKLILYCFGVNGMYDSKPFSYQNLIEIGTQQKIINIISHLHEFYLPCKGKVYLNIEKLSLRRCITILNHFLRSQGFTLRQKHKPVTTYAISFYSSGPNKYPSSLSSS